MAVVTPVVLCAKATEKTNKTLKLVVCYQKVFINIVKHIKIPISLIVAGYRRKAGVIARMIHAL